MGIVRRSVARHGTLLIASLVLAGWAGGDLGSDSELHAYSFDERSDVVPNPYVGWMFNTRAGDVDRFVADDESVFPRIDGKGPIDYFDVVHIKVGWEELEPRPGEFDFDDLYQRVEGLKDLGKTVFVSLVVVSDQIPVWSIRGTPCWHWATATWNPCEFDARTDFIRRFRARGHRNLRGYLRSRVGNRSLGTHLKKWDDHPTTSDAIANRVGYACHVARNCRACKPASDPLTLEYTLDGLEKRVSTSVCDVYYTGFCFESPDVVKTTCRMPPTIHPLYGTRDFQERLGKLLGALADYEVQFEQRNDGKGIDALYVGNMGTSGEWDQGRNAYPWNEHTLQDAARIFNDVMRLQIDSLQKAGWQLFTAVPSWPIDALKRRLSLPMDSPDAEVAWAYLDHSGLGLALERGVNIYHAGFGSWPPPVNVREAIGQYRGTRLVAGEPWREPWHDDPSQILTQMLASRANMISFGTANPIGWKALTCLGQGRIPAGGLPEPYRHCQEGVDYGLRAWPDLWQQARLGMGYRLHLSRVAYPRVVESGAAFSIHHEWQNLGVGRLVPGYKLQFLLENERGGIVWKRLALDVELADLVNDDPYRDAAPEPTPVQFTSSFRIHESVMPERTYKLKVGIVADTGVMNGPNAGSIRLDMEQGMEDAALHYYLGDLRVVGDGGA